MTSRRSVLQGLAALPIAAGPAAAGAAASSRPKQATLVTEAEMAAMEFEPWPNADAMRRDLTKDRWDEASTRALVAVHFALTIKGKTKADVVTVVDRGEDQEWSEGTCFAQVTCETLQDSRTFLREIADILDHAEVRFMCAVAAAIENEAGKA